MDFLDAATSPRSFHYGLWCRDGKVVMGGDGQVTVGSEVLKHNARKVRRLYNDKVLAGFAGSTADAFSLFERFDAKLEQCQGRLARAVVELAKDWRTDKILRHLEALLLVADLQATFLLSGNGDVIEPDEGGPPPAPAPSPWQPLPYCSAHHLERPPDRPGVHGRRRAHLHLHERQRYFEELADGYLFTGAVGGRHAGPADAARNRPRAG
jgi:hypothetical protein